MPKRRYRAALALFAALWVAALGLGDLARGIHLLAEPHILCFEHGELVEGAKPAGAVSAPGARPTSSAFAAQHVAIGHHVHCAIAAKSANLTWALLSSSPVVGLVDIPSRYAVRTPNANGIPQIAILAVAPKQSPPV